MNCEVKIQKQGKWTGDVSFGKKVTHWTGKIYVAGYSFHERTRWEPNYWFEKEKPK